MSNSVRALVGVFLATSLLGANLHAAPYDAAHAAAELYAIRTLAQQSSLSALERLDAFKPTLGNDVPYAMRSQLLLLEIRLRRDAEQRDLAEAVERETLKLALANHDLSTAAVARLGEVGRFLSNSQPAEAEQALARIKSTMPNDAPAYAQVAVARYEGDVYNDKSQFDKALRAYLAGLKLEQGQADGGESRAELMARIARLYINIDNPAKAVETTKRGLAEQRIPARTTANLQYAQGMALINLNRGAEGIAAFERALATAQQGSLTRIEAGVRGNIADYYLRQHDYPRAEKEARLALGPSEKVHDQNLIMMAKANTGFALMGQGKIAAGLPFVDEVTAGLRKAGSTTDVEAMMDEKSRMLEQAGLYKDALATVREQQVVSRTTSRAARDRAIAALQEQFDAGERTRQIELLRRENQVQDADLRNRRVVQIGTTAAAILTVLAGFFMYVLYRRAARANGRLHELNTQLEFHSMRDSLTGLHNRRSLQQKMESRAVNGKRVRRQDPVDGVDCFVLMDIDHFKHINDRWGHGVGDSVLVEVARRLNATVRDSDMVLRWGGEEFMIYAPGAHPAHVAEMVERVLAAIASMPVQTGANMVPVTLTAGVICLPPSGACDDELDWQRAIRLADWALYHGKEQGRNQAVIVTKLNAPIETVLAALENAKNEDLPQGLITLECVRGPHGTSHAAPHEELIAG